MRKCIYCGISDENLFKGREHVVPQSFGTFGTKTPTLHCVCDECNGYFKKELDQVLARDTLEGVTRYKKGKTSRERQFPKRVTFTLEETEENGEYGGALLGGYDPKTGLPLPVLPQFWIYNIQNKKWEKYQIDEIKNIEIKDDVYGPATPGSRQMRIFAPSQAQHEEVIKELAKYKIPYKEKEKFGPPPFLKGADPAGKLLYPER